MIGWLRRMLAPRPPDLAVERLAARHARRIAVVEATVQRAHQVADRILGEAFHDADGAAFRGPPNHRARP